MEASRGSPAWQSFFLVNIGEEEPETLEDIDPHWRATNWLQVVVQGMAEEEVPWYKLVTPLTLGVEGVALTILNIGQFITNEEMAGDMGEPHWFMAYSCVLQQVGEVAHGRKWEWPRREVLEDKASLLVRAFWHETGMDLTVASIKRCWEPTPRALYHQRESGPTAHAITYLDELAVHVPSLDTWDQMMWPTAVAIPRALTEAELYGYCQGQAVDLGPVMPAAQF